MNRLTKALGIGLIFSLGAGILPLAAQYTEEEWIPKIRFDLSGSWMSSVFGDMYLIGEADDDFQTFYYSNRYTWMYTQGGIEYWSVEGLDDGFPNLKRAIPLEIKARFQSPWYMVTFGLGFRTFNRKIDQSLPIEYVRAVNTNEGYAETFNFDHYRLQVTGYALPITGYYNMTEGRGVDAGLYVGVGPFFAKAMYEKIWTEGFESIINGEREQIAPTISRSLRMEGKGWGLLFEAGTRLDFNISRPFALFIEAGYAYHVVFSLSGAGREVNGAAVETWDGKWMIRKKTLTAEWDTEGTEIELIDNRPTAGADVIASENFSLNITGGVIKIGISIRL
ncbi:MAG: hypothetical protein JW843_03230 [Candidatus Aminicenantes bacterium]|nr:hypothetical protein [Candidatus Aminicenantes bacterium]